MFKWVTNLFGHEKTDDAPAVKAPAHAERPLPTPEEENFAIEEVIGAWTLGRNTCSGDSELARQEMLKLFSEERCEKEGDRRFLDRLCKTLSLQDLELPQFPDVARELNQMMSDPRTDVSRLAKLIERDPSLVKKVWVQASSARYRRPPEGLQEAIARVGTSELWRIAMRAAFDSAVFKVPGYQDEAEEVRFHGYITAEVAAWMAGDMRGMAYLAGLLHDVGKLIIFRCASGDPANAIPSEELVHRILRDHHASIGTLVAAAWQMDGPVAAALGFHHDPSKAPEDHRKLAWYIRLADILAHTAWQERKGNEVPGLKAISEIRGIKLNAEAAMEEARSALDRFLGPTKKVRAV